MLAMAGLVMEDSVGHPAGVAVGTEFTGRSEMSSAGVHLPPMRGIAARNAPRAPPAASGGSAREAYPLATSIVDSGGYSEPSSDGRAVLEYRGQGGRDPKSQKLSQSQLLTKVRHRT